MIPPKDWKQNQQIHEECAIHRVILMLYDPQLVLFNDRSQNLYRRSVYSLRSLCWQEILLTGLFTSLFPRGERPSMAVY